MSRHRNVRKMSLDDECDYDDYGRSVEEEYCISPGTAAEFMFDRSSNRHEISDFFKESDIAEEEHESEEGQNLPQLSQVEEAKLRSCLDEIRNVVGENFTESVLVNAILAHKFEVEKALDAVLSKKFEPEPPRPQRQRRERNIDSGYSNNGSYSSPETIEESKDRKVLTVKNGFKNGFQAYGVSNNTPLGKELSLLSNTFGLLSQKTGNLLANPKRTVNVANKFEGVDPNLKSKIVSNNDNFQELSDSVVESNTENPPKSLLASVNLAVSHQFGGLSLTASKSDTSLTTPFPRLCCGSASSASLLSTIANNHLAKHNSSTPSPSLSPVLSPILLTGADPTPESSLAELAKNHLKLNPVNKLNSVGAPNLLLADLAKKHLGDKSLSALAKSHMNKHNVSLQLTSANMPNVGSKLGFKPNKQKHDTEEESDDSSNGDSLTLEEEFDLRLALNSSAAQNKENLKPKSPEKSLKISSLDDSIGNDSWVSVMYGTIESPVKRAKPSMFGKVISLRLKTKPPVPNPVKPKWKNVIKPFDFSTPSPDDVVLARRMPPSQTVT